MGAGRSGTSMLAGMFSEAGYHMGEKLYPARDTNPKGFFESEVINSINETILKKNAKRTITERLYKGYNRRLKKCQRWLCDFRSSKRFALGGDSRGSIETETAKQPFCYKDPRFAYTYPLWAPYCGDHVCLVVYRHPAKTIDSMVREISSTQYLESYELSVRRLNKIWARQYANILAISNSKFMFVHFDQVFERRTVDKMQNFIGCNDIVDFTDQKLKRSTGESFVPDKRCMTIYEQLNQKSGYQDLLAK